MWKETGELVIRETENKGTMFGVALKGFLTNILNLKLTLFFLAFFPQFIPAHSISGYITKSTEVTKYIQRTFAAPLLLARRPQKRDRCIKINRKPF